MKLDIEMNQSSKRDEREKKRLRKKLIWQRKERERERKNEGPIWAELELISRWLVVVACDGDDWCGGGGLWRSNEGLERRESSG